ncbi:nucleophosmin-like [Hylobates moloch]|uniref:nucleophosmin-like n=1 Tax=Hylobates moloch TaxID=81572 RepID=UPI002675793A|nr:nucleophosmin-like [Hylobates moloch]
MAVTDRKGGDYHRKVGEPVADAPSGGRRLGSVQKPLDNTRGSADNDFSQRLFVAWSTFSHPCTLAPQPSSFPMLLHLPLWQTAFACSLVLGSSGNTFAPLKSSLWDFMLIPQLQPTTCTPSPLRGLSLVSCPAASLVRTHRRPMEKSLDVCRHPIEDSMDMDMSPLRPQNYLFGCELKADKDDHFKVGNDENEHQLSLRTASLGAGAKDELHIVEEEAMNYEGSPIKVTLATLKMSAQPTVSRGGFEITPPVVLRLKCGSGPVHISGQHLIAVEEDAESEDEEEEDVKLLSISGKQSAPGGGSRVPQKKVKLAVDEDDDDDGGFDDEEAEEKVPVKKGQESFKKQEKTPKTPKGPSSVEDIKAKMQASIEKGGSLPKVEAEFINYVKNCFWLTDQEAIQDLWQWRKSP